MSAIGGIGGTGGGMGPISTGGAAGATGGAPAAASSAAGSAPGAATNAAQLAAEAAGHAPASAEIVAQFEQALATGDLQRTLVALLLLNLLAGDHGKDDDKSEPLSLLAGFALGVAAAGALDAPQAANPQQVAAAYGPPAPGASMAVTG